MGAGVGISGSMDGKGKVDGTAGGNIYIGGPGKPQSATRPLDDNIEPATDFGGVPLPPRPSDPEAMAEGAEAERERRLKQIEEDVARALGGPKP
jgi:hypothetical protein